MLMLNYFWNYIDIVIFNINLNIFFKIWPIVFLAYKFYSFINTKITCLKIIIVLIDKFNLNNFEYKW